MVTMRAETLDTFIEDVASLVSSTGDEYEITKRVAGRLSALLASGYRLPPEFTRPSGEHHVTYPLYIAPDDSWTLAAVVWNAGQRKPVHGHETWGVAGIYSGAEHELRYVKPTAAEAGRPLTPAGEYVWERGQVTVCCTTDDDVHAVAAVGDEPTSGSTSTETTSAPSTAGPTTRQPEQSDGSSPAGTARQPAAASLRHRVTGSRPRWARVC
jgi:predicted metal-dependent enzyme (double-stranded beta helix superfamily)